MLARFGGDNGTILHFGTDDQKFLGIGCMVGYAIIVPAILGTYLMGATHTFLVSTYKSSILLLIKNKKYQNVFIVFFYYSRNYLSTLLAVFFLSQVER